MWRFCAGALAVLTLLPAVRTQDEPEKKVEPPTPMQQFQELVAEHRAAMNKFMAEYQKATTAEERQKLMQESYPQPKDYAAKFLEFVEKYPEDPVSDSAVSWILQYAGATEAATTAAKSLLDKAAENPKGLQSFNSVILVATRTRGPVAKEAAEMLVDLIKANQEDPAIIRPLVTLFSSPAVPKELVETATTALLDNFVNNDELSMVCLSLGRSEANRPILQKIMEKTTNRSVKGHAMFATATSMLGRPVTPNKEAEELLTKVIADFGDVDSYRGTLGKMAEGPLFEMQHLQIGMVAPNIEGQDVDDESFQLTDYLGKVVVLDFWGDW